MEKISNFFISLTSKIMSIGGHIPKSVAIIMDGNRRYAQKKKVVKIKGHEDGLETLLKVLLWCIELTINEVTVFAFSIDNFNRPKEEVDSLMTLAKEKFKKLSSQGEFFSKNGVQVCFYGNESYLDQELTEIINQVQTETKINSRIKLNVCIPYNSSEEIHNAVQQTQEIYKEEINLEKKENSKIDLKQKFESNLYGGYNVNPDIVIRTSGEIRLSNFLLYQSRFSQLFFVEKFWPEFTFYDFFSILVRYNINYTSHLRAIKQIETINN